MPTLIDPEFVTLPNGNSAVSPFKKLCNWVSETPLTSTSTNMPRRLGSLDVAR